MVSKSSTGATGGIVDFFLRWYSCHAARAFLQLVVVDWSKKTNDPYCSS